MENKQKTINSIRNWRKKLNGATNILNMHSNLGKHLSDLKGIFWTSVKYLGSEGRNSWSSSGKAFLYNDWNAREPNNYGQSNGNDEDCILISYKYNHKWYKWNHRNCTYEYYFFCQKIVSKLDKVDDMRCI